jgi:hypothetical protein
MFLVNSSSVFEVYQILNQNIFLSVPFSLCPAAKRVGKIEIQTHMHTEKEREGERETETGLLLKASPSNLCI